ncbi:MAG: MOSC domain-containing protein, partial [Pseudomonadota bacterium]
DRRWAFIKNNATRSGFPWLTLRENTRMSRYRPSFVNPDKPDASSTVVLCPSGAEYDVTDPALGLELSDEGARVIKQDRGVFDTFPVSLISVQTIRQLSEQVGSGLDVQRFRPNILIDTGDAIPYQEDDWVGKSLQLGDAQIRVDKRDGRCTVITLDPDTAERNPEVLRTVAKEREGCLGIYGSTVKSGVVALDDVLFEI